MRLKPKSVYIYGRGELGVQVFSKLEGNGSLKVKAWVETFNSCNDGLFYKGKPVMTITDLKQQLTDNDAIVLASQASCLHMLYYLDKQGIDLKRVVY